MEPDARNAPLKKALWQHEFLIRSALTGALISQTAFAIHELRGLEYLPYLIRIRQLDL